VPRRIAACFLGDAWMVMVVAIFLILLDELALADMIAVGSRTVQ
jgi:hypothetical protein